MRSNAGPFNVARAEPVSNFTRIERGTWVRFIPSGWLFFFAFPGTPDRGTWVRFPVAGPDGYFFRVPGNADGYFSRSRDRTANRRNRTLHSRSKYPRCRLPSSPHAPVSPQGVPPDQAPLSLSQRPMPTAHRAAPGRPRGTAAAFRAGPGRPRRPDHADGDACATGRVALARPSITRSTVGNAPTTPDRLGRPVARGGGFGAEPDVARAPRALVRVPPSRGSGASPRPPVAASPSPRPDRRPRRRPS